MPRSWRIENIWCEEKDRARQARIDELSVHQGRNPTTVSQFLAQILVLQNKLNSLADARECYDPESGSSFEATQVPSQLSTIPSPRTMPRCDSGLPHVTQNWTDIMGNVFERPPAQEGQHSVIFRNSRIWHLHLENWGLIFQRQQGKLKRRSWNTQTQSHHFQSRSGIQNHTGGTSSHRGMMDPRTLITEWNHGNFPDSGISKLEVELRNWGLCADSRSSGHHALDQRNWDCQVNWWT